MSRKNESLSEAAKRARNEYHKQWRKRNPGKQSDYVRAYWERVASHRNTKA